MFRFFFLFFSFFISFYFIFFFFFQSYFCVFLCLPQAQQLASTEQIMVLLFISLEAGPAVMFHVNSVAFDVIKSGLRSTTTVFFVNFGVFSSLQSHSSGSYKQKLYFQLGWLWRRPAEGAPINNWFGNWNVRCSSRSVGSGSGSVLEGSKTPVSVYWLQILAGFKECGIWRRFSSAYKNRIGNSIDANDDLVLQSWSDF